MRVRFAAFDWVSGQYRDDLRLADVSSIEQQVGTSSSATGKLTVQSAPADWVTLLDPQYRMVAAIAEYKRGGSAATSVPLVGYAISQMSVGPDGIGLSLTSLEKILEQVTVDDADFDGVDEAVVAAAVLRQKVAPGWGFEVRAKNTGREVEGVTYTTDEQKTVAAALSELSPVDGGLEFTVRLSWADGDKRRLVKTIWVGPRVGTDLPDTVIDTVNGRTRTWDCGDGRLAVRTRVTSDGDTSATYVDADAIAAGSPPWESTTTVEQPQTGPDAETDPDAYLNRAAEASLRVRRRGLTTWACEIPLTVKSAPRVGLNLNAGDTVSMDLAATSYDPVPWLGMARTTGWSLGLSEGTAVTLTPTLYDDRDEFGNSRGDLPPSALVRARGGVPQMVQRLTALERQAAATSVKTAVQERRLDQSQGSA